MPCLRPLAALAVAAVLPFACIGSIAATPDNTDLAFSSAPALIDLCTANSVLTLEACKQSGTDKLVSELDRALQAALAKAPANIKPLLKRDHAWFGEMIAAAAEQMPASENPADREAFAKVLHDRVAALGRIEIGFGRTGVAGKWQDAFGSVTVAAAENGAYRVAIATEAIYGTEPERRWTCQATALVTPSADGWFAGEIAPEISAEQTAVGKDYKSVNSKPGPLVAIKMRHQGETLRVVVDERDTRTDTRPHCTNIEPVTASYFASGPADAAPATDSDPTFVAPTFDCTRPYSATDEEICADPGIGRQRPAAEPRLESATAPAGRSDATCALRRPAQLGTRADPSIPGCAAPGRGETELVHALCWQRARRTVQAAARAHGAARRL
jgi:hypothetical protein